MKQRRQNMYVDTIESTQSTRRNRMENIIFVSILLASVFLINLPFANLELLTADASRYLDMGRNLMTGRGAVTSYNLYQLWPGKYYPFLPYMQPIYPILAGAIFVIFGLKAVIGANILLAAINSVLLYHIMRLYFRNVVSFSVAFFVGFSFPVVYTAISPWTEQLHLFFLLLAVYIYLKKPRSNYTVGIIVGLSCLVRAAGLYNAAAFLLTFIILGCFRSETRSRHFKIIAGFLIVFCSYEAFCYLRYGYFYPQYLYASKVWSLSQRFPGAYYQNSLPVLSQTRHVIPFLAGLKNIGSHLFELSFTRKSILVFLPFILLYRRLSPRVRPLYAVFFLQGLCSLLGYAISFYWFPEIEALRLSLIPFFMFGSLGVLSAIEVFRGGLLRLNRVVLLSLVCIVVCFSSFMYFKDLILLREYYLRRYVIVNFFYRECIQDMHNEIRENTPPDALVATNFMQDALYFQRPVVSLPLGTALTEKNLEDYLAIFDPDYIVTNGEPLIEAFKKFGFRETRRKGYIVMLQKHRAKDPAFSEKRNPVLIKEAP